MKSVVIFASVYANHHVYKICKRLQQDKPEDHSSCIAHFSAEDMLKSVVTKEKKIKNTESE